MTRFSELARLQYERRLTPVEAAELDLCSAEVTFEDRLVTGSPVHPDTESRIAYLRKRFESLKGTPS